MSSFTLKIIALISMIIDHSNHIFTDDITILRYIGRIAFPIFAFQTTISYQKTKNRNKYMIKLLIFALISEIPYYLYFGLDSINILFTLLLGNICMLIYDKIDEKTLSISIILLLAILSDLFRFDYGAYGILLIMAFYIFRKNKKLMNISAASIISIHYLINLLMDVSSVTNELLLLIFTLSSLIFINLYNGKEGKKTKYLFYIIYPLHILIFYIIKRML